MVLKSNYLVIERLPIDRLRPMEPAVKDHPERQMNILRRGLKHYGQIIPIPTSPDYQIIDLEAVWRALKAIGATHVDVTVVHGKTPAELKALRLALNRTARDGAWNDQGLRAVLEELVAVGFDLDLTGFTPPEIDYTLSIDAPQANVEENGNDIPSVEESAVTALGAIWDLGDHRVICGDATDQSVVDRVLDGRLADVCFVDPPYNLKVDGFISGNGKNRHREFVQGTGELSEDEFFFSTADARRPSNIIQAGRTHLYLHRLAAHHRNERCRTHVRPIAV